MKNSEKLELAVVIIGGIFTAMWALFIIILAWYVFGNSPTPGSLGPWWIKLNIENKFLMVIGIICSLYFIRFMNKMDK